MRSPLFAATLALAAAAATAQQPTVRTILSNGPTQSRYDMVILGDGYRSTEQTRFDQDVQTFLTALFQRQPYQTFASYYNVHTVFRASQDSGADHPDANPPIFRNTAYNASYNTGGTARCLYIGNTSQALADAALAPANEGRVLVFVNDSRYGGCASTFAVSYNGSSMSEVQIHELGHSMGQLADEYDYANATYTGGEPGEANVTTSPVGQKWSHWHGFDGISAFEGAAYHQFGLWRPKSNCLMRSLGVQLCAVCKEQISKVTNSIVVPIDNPQPTATNVTLTVPAVQTFSFTNSVPAANSPLITWKLDGQVQSGATGTSFVLDSANVSIGQHTVEVSVQDRTALVRHDPNNLMRETRTWLVTVADPTAAQLRIAAFFPSQVWVQPGAEVDLTATLVNDGPAAAPAFTAEAFLGTTQQWSPNDVYLGTATIAGLGAGQQTSHQRRVRLPWSLRSNVVYYLFVVLDRGNVVRETNEADNWRMTGVVGQSGPCFTQLAFEDPLVYPHDAASVSIAAGGTVHPTVYAPCATAGSLYLIVWGCSGTQPGTTLAPGVTVPLNPDFCTGLALAGLNGSMFQQFFGTLDAAGTGRATFALPPASGLGVTPGHFAAVLLDGTPQFTAATNAVSILLGP
jgi:hypothetical protein